MPKVSQQEINDILWKACDTFRGTIDPAEYKNYILIILFVKYISDVWKDHYEEYRRAVRRRRGAHPTQAGARAVRAARGEFLLRLVYDQREAANVGELINKALEKIEDGQQGEARRRLPQHRLQLGSS